MLPFHLLPQSSASSNSVFPSHTSFISVHLFLYVSDIADAQADGTVESLNKLFLTRHRHAKRAVTVRNERPIPLPFEP